MDSPLKLDAMTRSSLRRWYLQHATSSRECWVQLARVSPPSPNALSYLDAVEEALCFGWIDSTVRRMDDGVTRQRFSPRRHGSTSNWSELNKARCVRLERLGLMTGAGRAALSHARRFCVSEEIVAALRTDQKVWKNYCAFPELYRRVRIDTIQIKRKQPDVFARRLAKFIDFTRRGEMFGSWNDAGRLGEDDVPPY